MKWVIRRVVRLINDVAAHYACETYGDNAEMHAGPCERCVGHAVMGVVADEAPARAEAV